MISSCCLRWCMTTLASWALSRTSWLSASRPGRRGRAFRSLSYHTLRNREQCCGYIPDLAPDPTLKPGFGSVFIWSGSGSSILGWIPIRIQSGSRVFTTKNVKKFTAEKKKFCIKREHPALQNMKLLNFFYFCGSFLPSWIRIRIPNTDPDSLTWLNPGPIRIWIRNPD